MNKAYNQIGGFGRFQVFTLFLMALIRNYGLYQQYGFAVLMMPQKFSCSYDIVSPSTGKVHPIVLSDCPIQLICEQRKEGEGGELTNFSYEVNKEQQNYYLNWFVADNLACEDTKRISSVSSFYFFGFSLGILLLSFPDQYGRKKSMTVILPFYVAASFLTIYSSNLNLKSVGYFMQGFLHSKITLSYSHMFELTNEENKGFCATFINAFDALSLFVLGFTLKFVTKDLVYVIQTVNLVETAAVFLYILLVPESPKWLILNGQQAKGIESLNYIAFVNGSSRRIPQNAQFDLIG
mmetsp:Transcript_8570/g.14455  ORF Transcript_8570/g.14455 Transcript_8570/m.14455 type:complete len:294 (-) Transcript_8570:913-1794(-)